MEIAEAREELTKVTNCWANPTCKAKCTECQYNYEANGEQILDCLRIALACMRRATPARPAKLMNEWGKGGEFFYYVCTSCGQKVTSEDNYCRQCGQKLNWEGKNEK